MAYNIFPGVYTTIKDESFFIQALPGAIGFCAGFFEKGPDNQLVMCTSPQQLITTYGYPNQAMYGSMWYIAKEYLEVLGNMYMIRVLPHDAEYSNVCLKFDSVTNTVYSFKQNNLNNHAEIDTLLNLQAADVVFFPVGRGQYYNKFCLKLTPSSEYTSFNCFYLDIYEESKTSGNAVLQESFLISFDEQAVDISNESLFVTHVLERYSDHIRAKTVDNIDGSLDWGTPFTTYMYMEYGSDGTMYNPATGYLDWANVQDDLVKAYTGSIYNPITGDFTIEHTDPECTSISVTFDAGYPTVVKNAILDFCNIREDTFAFLDNGDNTRPQDALTKRTTVHNFNDFRAGLYEEFTKVYDEYTGRYIWISPIYHVAKSFAKTAKNYDLWWPFAGLRRGTLSGIYDMRYRLVGKGYKDEFKLNQVNPIMKFSNGAIAIWGNWTTYMMPSSLQNVHVVLTLLYIKRVLERNLKYFIYELNDKYTWEVIKSEVSAFLGDIKSARGLEWYTVKVYATDYDKKLNRCQVYIDLKVTGAIEILNITLAVH